MKRFPSHKLSNAGRWSGRIACSGQDDIVDKAHNAKVRTRRHRHDKAKLGHNVDKLTTDAGGEEGV